MRSTAGPASAPSAAGTMISRRSFSSPMRSAWRPASSPRRVNVPSGRCGGSPARARRAGPRGGPGRSAGRRPAGPRDRGLAASSTARLGDVEDERSGGALSASMVSSMTRRESQIPSRAAWTTYRPGVSPRSSKRPSVWAVVSTLSAPSSRRPALVGRDDAEAGVAAADGVSTERDSAFDGAGRGQRHAGRSGPARSPGSSHRSGPGSRRQPSAARPVPAAHASRSRPGPDARAMRAGPPRR